ncbi:cAMP-binding proteins-catabolite gene activator and regulatory subunit of cAMP-dependent protein kinases [uncultured Candidatus Thioglobus sp.]|nr:cAMP-binding proteins-catabolite gene activator and regulatory subunit of cAMP-dependent protein kinases [uncultured Candidatus Thioglobus sp.]
MGSFKKADIVLFPFPFTDLEGSKLRPCLVLSDEMRQDLVLCQITSQHITKDNWTIELSNNETQKGNLKIDSYIRCNMLFTASKNNIVRKICEIDNHKYNEVVLKVNKLMAL